MMGDMFCLFVEATVVHRGVEQHHILAILSPCEDAVSGIEVFEDGVVHHGLAVGAVGGGDAHQVGGEGVHGILHEVILVAAEVERTAEAVHVDLHLIGGGAVGCLVLFVLCECYGHAHHDDHTDYESFHLFTFLF